MNPADFEVDVVLAADAALVAAVRDLAAHAAHYAGCDGADAGSFAAVVQTVVEQCLRAGVPVMPDAPLEPIRIIVRRQDGPLEVLVACGWRFEAGLEPDAPISVGWTDEAGVPMCRVARALPPTPDTPRA